MEWEQRYQLGHETMDRMHQEFVALVTQLSECDKSALPALLDTLIAHTTEHFAAEDSWMRQSAFPARMTHEGEHKRLLASLASAKRMLGKGFPAPALALGKELPGWFVDHSAKMDSALAAHLAAHPLPH